MFNDCRIFVLATERDRRQDCLAHSVIILKLPLKTICMKRQYNVSAMKLHVLLMKLFLEMSCVRQAALQKPVEFYL